MIELHSHVLFGMDDGATDVEQSLLMLSDYAAQGVTEIACTPHLLPETFASLETLTAFLDKRDETLATLQDAADVKKIAIRLDRGVELMLSSAMLPYIKIPAVAERMTLNGGSYILVELPHILSGGIRVLDGLLFELQLAGLLPILAHPERTAHNDGVMATLKEWVKSGRILLQVNAGHIVEDPRLSSDRQERYRRRRPIVRQMIEAELVHFVASDAHDQKSRPPQHSLAHQSLKSQYGEEIADRFLTDNPSRALLDEPIVG